MTFTEIDIERFWSRVDKSGDCWLWTAGKSGSGYGYIHTSKGMLRSHRMAYELHHGPITDGLIVCHKCDTPACVNPSHLFLGTNQDNMDDRKRKGRGVAGDRHWTRRHPERVPRGNDVYFNQHPEVLPRGEAHHKAKLTADAVREIRRRYAAGGVSQSALARAYGMNHSTIRDIVRGAIWKHV